MVEIAQERIHQGGDENGEGTVFFCAEADNFSLLSASSGAGTPKFFNLLPDFLDIGFSVKKLISVQIL